MVGLNSRDGVNWWAERSSYGRSVMFKFLKSIFRCSFWFVSGSVSQDLLREKHCLESWPCHKNTICPPFIPNPFAVPMHNLNENQLNFYHESQGRSILISDDKLVECSLTIGIGHQVIIIIKTSVLGYGLVIILAGASSTYNPPTASGLRLYVRSYPRVFLQQ